MTATVTISRRVQWMDTDAAGIWHHSVVLRWAEEAEAELHRRLGILGETFGATPRVRTEFEFNASLRFDDTVDVTLGVVDIGETSLTYRIEVVSEGKSIATGLIVAVFIDLVSGAKRPWSERIRTALSG